MRRLRSPSGCPWDREQTLHSLRSFLLEETYEVLDASDRNDQAELKNELGDLLFQIVFLAEICSESDSFTISNIITAIVNKLIDRHPHVFGEESGLRTPGSKPNTTKEVTGLWEQLKAKEKSKKKGKKQDRREIQRQVVALDAPRPRILRRRLAKHHEPVELRVAMSRGAIRTRLQSEQHRLELHDGLRLEIAVGRQRAAQKGVGGATLLGVHLL